MAIFAPQPAPAAPPAAAKDASEARPTARGRPPVVHANRRPLIALIGNPNTGKTTMFNRLTGARARVGNYPGVTVERRVGAMRLAGDRPADLLDLPGTYSLCARSREEQIAIEAVLGIDGSPTPDLTVVVVDAGQLIRNLYLAVQLIELEVPIVVALNMVDELPEPIDHTRLARLLRVPVVPTSARRGEGLDELRRAVERMLEAPSRGRVRIGYPQALLDELAPVIAALPSSWRRRDSPGRDRGLALWALSSLEPDDELARIPDALRQAVAEVHAASGERDLDLEIVGARYAFLDEHVARSLPPSLAASLGETAAETPARRLTDRVDAIVLHPVWGFAIFIALMLVVFQALFSWSDPAIGLIESAFAQLQSWVRAALPPGVLTNLLAEGVIGGAGNVVVFLPQILLLFFLLGLLEDSGYMSRAAYLMDRVMKALGLHGRAFVPMLSGCACAIPAIMATRTMERQRDRLLTMLVIPLMTCSARLPVYTLIIAALFPPSQLFGVVPVQGLLMVFMYVFSTLMALGAAGVIGRTVVRGRRIPLLLELPPYRLPTLRTVLRQMLERASLFLKEAGTVILACTVVLWALLSYPEPETPRPVDVRAVASWHEVAAAHGRPVDGMDVEALADNSAAVSRWQAEKLAGSWGGRIGKAIEPGIAPLGFDWRLGVGILGAFAAREVFVSTMGLVYGIGEVDEEAAPLRDRIRAETKPDGRPVYTPLVGLSLMLFFALACQCMSTLAVVRRETRSWRWPAFLFAYMTTLAYVVSLLVYQGGKLLGFE